ncbi:MAG TPA: hypothetical protein VKA70_09970 [Blastocatellia bacterium]|nr:hypothetical protein [Blastocatellia bacterium]
MYFISAIVGLAVGFLVWLTLSHWVAASITRAEVRNPALVGSRRIRVGEAVACGALFFGCLALAFWIAKTVFSF